MRVPHTVYCIPQAKCTRQHAAGSTRRDATRLDSATLGTLATCHSPSAIELVDETHGYTFFLSSLVSGFFLYGSRQVGKRQRSGLLRLLFCSLLVSNRHRFLFVNGRRLGVRTLPFWDGALANHDVALLSLLEIISEPDADTNGDAERIAQVPYVRCSRSRSRSRNDKCTFKFQRAMCGFVTVWPLRLRGFGIPLPVGLSVRL